MISLEAALLVLSQTRDAFGSHPRKESLQNKCIYFVCTEDGRKFPAPGKEQDEKKSAGFKSNKIQLSNLSVLSTNISDSYCCSFKCTPHADSILLSS